jgi:TetR/AcrR family fatty acid metabolism transcriptional regulator
VKNKRIEENRVKILEAAGRLFYGKRFHQVKVGEIAEAADMGKGTIYEYFPSKEKLFEELFKYSTEKYIRLARKAGAKKGSSRERLLAIVFNHIEFITRFSHLDYYIFHINRSNIQELHSWFQEKRDQFLSLVGEIIDEGIRRGEIRAMDSRLAAAAFTGSFLAALDPFLIDLEKDGKKIAAEVTALFFQGAGA